MKNWKRNRYVNYNGDDQQENVIQNIQMIVLIG